ncbi:MAG: 2Fe-2S iron-sulfur cluster-binding protein [Chloroflexota bacterium]|nr:(2Fe-2S)-binding protein [Chloroflexota bacterium]
MATITILPSGIKLEVEPGKTLLKAVLDSGVFWPYTCGGRAQCTSCAFTLITGGERSSKISRLEQFALAQYKGRRAAAAQKVKLACQTVIDGDMVVQKNLSSF